MNDMKIPVTVIGAPGKLALEIIGAVSKQTDMILTPFSLTGPEIQEKKINVAGKEIALYTSNERDIFAEKIAFTNSVIVDATLPSVVNDNFNFFSKFRDPIVVATTGGKEELFQRAVQETGISALIAPNMAEPIVALASFMKFFSERHPNLLEGYSLKLIESHQATKVDTSGTAKDMVKYFNRLGIFFTVEQIVKIRNKEKQLKMGIPPEYLDSHAWHSYYLNPDSFKALKYGQLFKSELAFFLQNCGVLGNYSVSFGSGLDSIQRQSPDKNCSLILNGNHHKGEIIIRHNINGRSIYADGIIEAIRFIYRRSFERQGSIFSMINLIQPKLKATLEQIIKSAV
jgi:4-hydroxy-tetrahydrodipicolinate reductase